ncbi:MAG: hypothetical protein GY810_28270 [Aureispira sp.]|nr:hypothetical protein [Aureispira sp.]
MKFFLLHSILMSILLMNLTAKEAQLLDNLHTKVSTLKKLKAKDPETFKTWLSKKDKKKQQQLKLAIVYSNKIKQLRAKKEGASEQKQAKIDQKIDKTIAKAKARGIEVASEDQEDNISRKQFMEKSQAGLDSISSQLSELNDKHDFSINLAVFKTDLVHMKMQTPFGDLLKADLQDRAGNLNEEKVIGLKEQISKMVGHFLNKVRRLDHYKLNANHFYKIKDLEYNALTEDLKDFVKLVDRCGKAPIVTDMRYISTTDDHKIKEKIKAAFVEWGQNIANVYAAAKFPKGTMVSSFKIKTELEKVFRQEDNTLIKQLYDSIEGSFNGQLELLANDAKIQVSTIINSYVNNDKYMQSLKDNGYHTISFKDYNAVGAALVNAKAEGSGDEVADGNLQEFFDEWKRGSIASLAPVEGDTQSFVDMYTLDAVGKGLASKSHESFNDFWNRVNAIFAGVNSSPTAITVKNSIEEEVNALNASDFFQKLPPTGKFPDIRTLAAYIRDVTMDTTFKSYQDKWETWRKKNLISTIGIPQDTDFYPERLKMLIGDLLGVFQSFGFKPQATKFFP